MKLNFLSSASDKGDFAEGLLMTELLSRGYSVSVPWGHNNLYDLIVENNKGKLLKVQVKYRIASDQSTRFGFGNLSKYIGEVDIMALLASEDWYFISKRTLSKLAVVGFKLHPHKFKANNFELFDK